MGVECQRESDPPSWPSGKSKRTNNAEQSLVNLPFSNGNVPNSSVADPTVLSGTTYRGLTPQMAVQSTIRKITKKHTHTFVVEKLLADALDAEKSMSKLKHYNKVSSQSWQTTSYSGSMIKSPENYHNMYK